MAKKNEETKRLSKRTKETKEKVKKKVEKEKEKDPILTEDMIEEIQNEILDLQENLSKSFRFAASAKRARKNTTNLQKMFKVFRAATVAYWKK